MTAPDPTMARVAEAMELGRTGRAGEALTDARAAAAGATGPVAAFYPSLHLNLGEDYRKVGDPQAARRHLDLGLAAAAALPDDGYGAMIRGGLEGLAQRLAEAGD